MEIKIMEPKDYESAMILWYGSEGVGQSPDDTKEYITNYLIRNPHTSFVAVEEGELIGAIMAGHDGYRGYIHHTAVLEEYRNQGVGSLLVENALDAMKREGIKKVALVAFETNKSGNEFWQSRGFTVREDLIYRNLRISD